MSFLRVEQRLQQKPPLRWKVSWGDEEISDGEGGGVSYDVTLEEFYEDPQGYEHLNGGDYENYRFAMLGVAIVGWSIRSSSSGSWDKMVLTTMIAEKYGRLISRSRSWCACWLKFKLVAHRRERRSSGTSWRRRDTSCSTAINTRLWVRPQTRKAIKQLTTALGGKLSLALTLGRKLPRSTEHPVWTISWISRS